MTRKSKSGSLQVQGIGTRSASSQSSTLRSNPPSRGRIDVCKLPLIGAIAGDIIGSTRERHPERDYGLELFKEDSRFTDDTVMLLAVAEAAMSNGDYASHLRKVCRRHPKAGYGTLFSSWVGSSAAGPYGSWGNGSAVRAIALGWIYKDYSSLHEQSRLSAEVTHDHDEGLKGADAAVQAVSLVRMGASKDILKSYMELSYGYDLSKTDDDIRPGNTFDVSCQVTVPHAIVCFLCSSSYEDCIRRAVSLGGDADSLGCLAGAIAQAYYDYVPGHIAHTAYHMLTKDLKRILLRFDRWLSRN